MLRTSFIAAALLLTPLAALASGDRHGYYEDRYPTTSRVVVAEPRIAVAIGGGAYNGFNLLYQSGGYRHPVVMPAYYAPVVVREPYYPPHRAQYRHEHRDWHDDRRHRHNRDRYRGNGGGHYDRGWDD